MEVPFDVMQLQYLDEGPYRPGACNIGPEELSRRRSAAVGATIAAVAVAVAIVALGLPPIVRWALAPVAIGAAVSWEQVFRKFCVAFGAAGVRNFGPLGVVSQVGDRAAAAADRRHALRMLLEGTAIGLVVTVLFVALPI